MSLKTRIARTEAEIASATTAIFTSAWRSDMTLAECRAIAPWNVKTAYDNAVSRLDGLKAEAVASGRAYRGSFGMLVWNR